MVLKNDSLSFHEGLGHLFLDAHTNFTVFSGQLVFPDSIQYLGPAEIGGCILRIMLQGPVEVFQRFFVIILGQEDIPSGAVDFLLAGMIRKNTVEISMGLIVLPCSEIGDSTAEQCDLMRGSLFQNTAETSDTFTEMTLDEGFLGFDQDSFCLFIGRRVFCKI